MESEKRDDITTCRVYIIINNNAFRSYNLKFIPNTKLIYLKIIIKHPSDIETIVTDIENTITGKFICDIDWNWKNIPSTISGDAHLRERIIRIFTPQKEVEESLDSMKPETKVQEPETDYHQPKADLWNLVTEDPRRPLIWRSPSPPQTTSMPLSTTATSSTDFLVAKVIMQINTYHSNPDMHNLSNPKKKGAVINYIRNVTSQPKLDENRALEIAWKVSAELKRQESLESQDSKAY